MIRWLIAAAVLVTAALAQDTARPASIEGRVLTLAGDPIRKATVRLEGAGTATRSYRFSSDAGGRFSLEPVEPGDYQISAERPGYLPQGDGEVIMLAPAERRRDVVI